ncbi:MAG TPA: alpha/beta fold hydrolase, partial [Xanthobacteraceae bacterium]|nr:alpha/beta fold hydrolase [Xanthobacteraceae bacterium]
MLAIPVKSPPPLASIHAGAQAIGHEGRPELSRFQARDGTWLAYRLYPAQNGARDRLVILAHGSSASSDEMHVVARSLAENGVSAVAIDARGHGASGTRGDIAYIGQLDDDMTDLVGELRKSYADAQLTLIGHSSGGGFGLRIAAGPVGALFDRFVLLAPYLGHSAPTNRPAEKASRWAEPDIPRILALAFLRGIGIEWPQSLPVIAFANAPEATKFVTSRYSFRLLIDYGPPPDWEGALRKSAARIDVIAGDADELMDAAAYKSVLPSLGVHVVLLPNVDHMGVVYQPAALAAILETTVRRKLTQR